MAVLRNRLRSAERRQPALLDADRKTWCARAPELIEGKRATAIRALGILDEQLATRDFIAGSTYSIADISIFAYAHLAGDAGIPTAHLGNFQRWVERVRAQDRFLAEMYPYSIDPHASAELP